MARKLPNRYRRLWKHTSVGNKMQQRCSPMRAGQAGRQAGRCLALRVGRQACWQTALQALKQDENNTLLPCMQSQRADFDEPVFSAHRLAHVIHRAERCSQAARHAVGSWVSRQASNGKYSGASFCVSAAAMASRQSNVGLGDEAPAPPVRRPACGCCDGALQRPVWSCPVHVWALHQARMWLAQARSVPTFWASCAQ